MVSIDVDDVGVRGQRAGEPHEIRWADLVEVRVDTTSDGPFLDDVFFGLAVQDGTFTAIPQSATTPEFIVRLQALSGFDNEALIASMGSTERATFICWRAEAS